MPDSTPIFPYIVLGTPSTGVWKSKMAVCAIDMAVMSACGRVLVKAIGAEGAYTETNRNNIVRAVLASVDPIAGILWIDSDMQFPPDTLLHLMSHKKDIVGATYRERQEPYRYLGKFADDNDAHAWEAGLQRMDLMPGGMILVRTEVYRRLPPPWYKLDEEGWRDDYHFCVEARAAGYEVWCDLDLTRKVIHRGEQEVGWFQEGEEAARRSDDARWRVFDQLPRAGGVNSGGAAILSARRA